MTALYRLHYAPDNASLVIRLTLEDLAVPYTAVLVDRARQGQRAPAYLALNPNGLIPVLDTPHGPIFETGAILLWLSEVHGRLAPPPGRADRGAFLKWLAFVSNTLHPDLRMSFYPAQYLGDAAGCHPLLCRHAQGRVGAHLDKLESLARDDPPWFGHPVASVLDYYVVCLLRWRALYPQGAGGDFDLARWPRMRALARRIEAGAPARAAVIAEGLGPRPFSAPVYPDPPEGSAT